MVRSETITIEFYTHGTHHTTAIITTIITIMNTITAMSTPAITPALATTYRIIKNNKIILINILTSFER